MAVGFRTGDILGSEPLQLAKVAHGASGACRSGAAMRLGSSSSGPSAKSFGLCRTREASARFGCRHTNFSHPKDRGHV